MDHLGIEKSLKLFCWPVSERHHVIIFGYKQCSEGRILYLCRNIVVPRKPP